MKTLFYLTLIFISFFIRSEAASGIKEIKDEPKLFKSKKVIFKEEFKKELSAKEWVMDDKESKESVVVKNGILQFKCIKTESTTLKLQFPTVLETFSWSAYMKITSCDYLNVFVFADGVEGWAVMLKIKGDGRLTVEEKGKEQQKFTTEMSAENFAKLRMDVKKGVMAVMVNGKEIFKQEVESLKSAKNRLAFNVNGGLVHLGPMEIISE
jgi:hypothetical protein